MTIKTINLKNISDSAIIIGDYKIIKDEFINIPLNKINNVMWKNIIALVNKKDIEYKVVDIEDKNKEENKNKEEDKKEKEKSATKKKTIKKTNTKETTTKKKKEE